MPCARTGGHAAAQAAAQELFPRESLRNRYTVRPRESTSTLPRLPAGSSPMVAGRPLAVFGGRGVSLPPPQAAMTKAASGALTAVNTMRRETQREFIGPMLAGPRPRSRQHSDRPTPEPDRHPSPSATRRPGAPVVRLAPRAGPRRARPAPIWRVAPPREPTCRRPARDARRPARARRSSRTGPPGAGRSAAKPRAGQCGRASPANGGRGRAGSA
jgi:hypothetical protein